MRQRFLTNFCVSFQGYKSTDHKRKKKIEFIKIKNIFSLKTTVKIKKQTTDWENTFTKHMSGKRLVFMYKEYIKNFYNLIRQQSNPIKKQRKPLHWTFDQRIYAKYRNNDKHARKDVILLVIREMQITLTLKRL